MEFYFLLFVPHKHTAHAGSETDLHDSLSPNFEGVIAEVTGGPLKEIGESEELFECLVFDKNDVQSTRNVVKSKINQELIDDYLTRTKSTAKVGKLNPKFLVEARKPGAGLRSVKKPTNRYSPDSTKKDASPKKRKRTGKGRGRAANKSPTGEGKLKGLQSSEKRNLKKALARHIDGSDGSYEQLQLVTKKNKTVRHVGGPCKSQSCLLKSSLTRSSAV